MQVHKSGPFYKNKNRPSLQEQGKRPHPVELKKSTWRSIPVINTCSNKEGNTIEAKMTDTSQSTEELNELSKAINSPVTCGYLRYSSSSSSSYCSTTDDTHIFSGKSSITSMLESRHNESTSTLYSDIRSDSSRRRRSLKDLLGLSKSIDIIQGHPKKENPKNNCLTQSYDKSRENISSPKVLFVHVKTPDTERKTRQDILKEFEEAQKDIQKETENKTQEPKRKYKKNERSIYKSHIKHRLFAKFEQKKNKQQATGNKPPIMQSLSLPESGHKTSFNTSSQNTLVLRHHQSVHSRLSLDNKNISCDHVDNRELISQSDHHICNNPTNNTESIYINNYKGEEREFLRYPNYKTSSLPRELSNKIRKRSVPDTIFSSSLDPINQEDFIFQEKLRSYESNTTEELDDTLSVVSTCSTDSDGTPHKSITEDLAEDTIKEFNLIALNSSSKNYKPQSISSINSNLFESSRNNDRSLTNLAMSHIIMEEDSDCEGSDTNVKMSEDESSDFEKQFEKDMEMFDEKHEDEYDETVIKVQPEPVTVFPSQSRRDFKDINRHNLKLDLHSNSNEPFIQQVHKRQLIRQISQEPIQGREDVVILRPKSSSSTSGSCPSTPRSPVIDIEDAFKQREQELEKHPVDDMTKVKSLTQRLNLPTRRPSYLSWQCGIRSKYEAKKIAEYSPQVVDEGDGKSSVLSDEERKDNLKKAMEWLKDELTQMREQDQHLARQLWHLQLEMQKLRLVKSCSTHQAIVEEVTCDTAEQKAYMNVPDVSDSPSDLNPGENWSSILKNIGVTRWNISNRRFSLR